MRCGVARCVCACVVAWAGGAEAASLPASGVEVELNAARWRVSRGEGVDVIERVSPRRPAVRVQVTRVDGRGEVGCGALLGELARKTGGRVLSGEFAPRWHEAWVVFEGDAGVVGNVGCLDVGGGQMVVATVSSAGEGLADAREVFDALSDGALGPAEVGWGVEGLQLSSSVLGVWAPAVEPAGSDGVMGGVAVSAWAGGAGFGLRYGVDVSLAGGLGPGLYADVGGGGGVGLGVGPLEVSALLLLGADWLGSWGTSPCLASAGGTAQPGRYS